MNELDTIFDAFFETSKKVHLQDNINKKKAQLKSIKAKRCGNCDDWMKSTCIPEKKYGDKKNINSLGCKDFSPDSISKELEKKYIQELRELEKEIT